MVSISGLQLVVGEAHVCFAYIVVFPLHTSLVYDRRLKAVSIKRAVIHVSAVACFVICDDIRFAVVVMFLELLVFYSLALAPFPSFLFPVFSGRISLINTLVWPSSSEIAVIFIDHVFKNSAIELNRTL